MTTTWVDTLTQVFVHLQLVAAVFSIFFFAWAAQRLYKQRMEPYFSRRGLSFIVPIFIFCFCGLMLTTLDGLLKHLSYVDLTHDQKLELNDVFSHGIYFTLFGFMTVSITRIFNYYISISRTQAANQEMRQISIESLMDEGSADKDCVDPHVHHLENKVCTCWARCSWCEPIVQVDFPSMCPVFGTEKKLATMACVVWVLECICSTSLLLSDPSGRKRIGVRSFLVVVSLIHIVCVWYFIRKKTFQFNDVWFIASEFKKYARHFAKSLVFVMIFFGAEQIIKAIDDRFSALATVYGVIVTTYLMCGLVYIMIIWVDNINKQSNNNIILTNHKSVNNDANDAHGALRIPSPSMFIASGSHYDLNKWKGPSDGSNPSSPSDMSGIIKVWKLMDFFDKSFDKSSNYLNVSKQFRAFVGHVKRELSLENLNYYVISVQLKQFLVANEFIGKDIENFPLRDKVQIDHLVQDTLVIAELKDSFKNNISAANHKDFAIFVPLWNHLYKYYFERDKAKFEINISHDLRSRIEEIHSTVTTLKASDKNLTKEEFEAMWNAIAQASIRVFELLHSSFRRFKSQYLDTLSIAIEE